MKAEWLDGEFDHLQTGIYIPIDTLLLLFTPMIDNPSQFKNKNDKKVTKF
jgi:hypothetical protein